MTPRAQAFYDACCKGYEWDRLAALALDMADADVESYPYPDVVITLRDIGQQHCDPYRWTTIQPMIDKQLSSYREGVRDHYEWRNPFGTV